jgi:hypothetical protein
VARRLWLQYKMGLDLAPSEEWPGSGIAYAPSSFVELNERNFYRRWLELIGQT